MKIIFIILANLFLTFNILACDYLEVNEQENAEALMGKKSKIYDAYKQGKCVLENALEPLTDEQRKVIANLIAKSYITVK